MKLGGIEAGGTKMVCAIGDEQGKIFDRAVFPTETPESTVPKMIAYFQDKNQVMDDIRDIVRGDYIWSEAYGQQRPA